jgi:HK97 family phage prohead protease
MNSTKRIRGLAVPYNDLSADLGGFQEMFLPGVFNESLRGGEIFCDIEHDRKLKLGRKTKNTLSLTDTPGGLWAEIILPQTQLGGDVLEDVKNGNLDGMSIAFTDPLADFERKNGKLVRVVRKATLRAISLTGFAAYGATIGTVTVEH